MLTAQRDELPDMDRIRRPVLASALSESLLRKWYSDTRNLPWWLLDDMRDDELRDVLDMAVDMVRRSERFRAGAVGELNGDDPPPEARKLVAEAKAVLDGDLGVRTPRDIPAGDGFDGGRRHRDGVPGNGQLFSKLRRRSDDHR